jgi:hypothetical protein
MLILNYFLLTLIVSKILRLLTHYFLHALIVENFESSIATHGHVLVSKNKKRKTHTNLIPSRTPCIPSPRRVHGSPSDTAFLGIVPGGAAPAQHHAAPSTLTSAPGRQGAGPCPLPRHLHQHRRNEVRPLASSAPSSSSAPEETRRGSPCPHPRPTPGA